MTNGTEPTENGVADASQAVLAATITSTPTTELAEPAPAEPKPPSFDDFGLHPDVKQALDDMGYFTPTAVQVAVFKPVSEGKDLMVQSRTGTGKTTAFGLPLINKMVPTHRAPQALLLAPTRELALQVARELTQIGKHRGILVEAVYGGAPIGKQIAALRDGVHIVVGTPGRVLDHIGRRTLDCKTISTFVLDECDEMLSMGFLEDIERVVAALPEKKQTLLFSATMPDEVTRYSRRHMTAPENISLSRDSVSVSDIHHAYYIVSGIARSRDLLKILFAENPESAIIFCNMRDETTAVAKFLQKQGLDAEPLSSDLSQADRERVMNRMKQHNLRFLVATDVAARGIDITNLSHVINFSVPESPEVYVHRTGRTGRAGLKGTALSLVGPRELGNFRYVRLQFGIKPEERLLPKDDIFVGKLKVPLPPIGAPTPPDPVQILIRGVPPTTAGISDLEKQIFEKLLANSNGRRVLAQLVAEKLDQLSTKAKPKRERPERTERPEGHAEASEARGPGEERSERPRFDRDRPERGDRDRGDRPRFGGDRGDRPRFGEDRGDRPRFDRDRGPRGEGDRGPRGEGGEGRRDFRDRGERPAEGARPSEGARAAEGARPTESGTDRPNGERTDRPNGERSDRPNGERSFDRGERRDYRDRERGDRPDRGGERHDRGERHEHRDAAPATEPTTAVTETAAPASADARPERNDRDRDRDRGRGGRDRDRRDYRDRDRGDRPVDAAAPAVVAAPVAAAPVVAPAAVEVTEVLPKVDDVARAALDRADRGKKRGTKSEPTADTQEFWETWAAEKSTRSEAEPAKAAPRAARETEAEAEPAAAEGRRGRDRGKGRKDVKDAKDAKPAKDDKPERGRVKRDTTVTPPAAIAANGDGQTRLFISLGKKHGVSADDLRKLLSGPIGGDAARIGSVSLRDSHAHVRVPEDVVEAIIAGVHGTKHNDHSVTVERARA